jgi:hypothetical protein
MQCQIVGEQQTEHRTNNAIKLKPVMYETYPEILLLFCCCVLVKSTCYKHSAEWRDFVRCGLLLRTRS